MKHTIVAIENRINKELENKQPFINQTYRAGYRQALIDIKNIILNNDLKELVGKYGYFWDEEKGECEFGKLIIYDEYHANPYGTKKNQWKNFSLTVPEHLK